MDTIFFHKGELESLSDIWRAILFFAPSNPRGDPEIPTATPRKFSHQNPLVRYRQTNRGR